jgi:cellulose synthase operon protein C
VLSASAAGNSQAILAALEADPALLDENDLEVVWAAGSAYAREGRVSRASALFDLGVRAARDDAELRGTLYKARDVLPMQPVQALLATAQTLHAARAGHRAVIEQFQLDLLRDELGAQLEAWRLEPDSTHPLNHQAMGAIEASWQDGQGLGSDTARRAADYELLGWAWFAQGDNDRSLALFRQAMAIAPSGIAATADGNSPTLQGAAHYGAALALRRSGDGEASLGLLAQAFTDSSGPGNRGDDRLMALYVETLGDALYGLESAVDLTLERVAQYTQFVSQLEDAPGAQALGWYAYRGQQFIPAAAWFAKSLEWRASQSAAEGLVRSTWQLGQHEEARQLLEHHAALFPELSSLSIELAEPVTRQAVAGTARQSQSTRASSAVASAAQAQRAGDPRRCLSLLEGTRPSEEATLIGAWCLMDLGRPHEAATQFATVIAGLSQANSRDAGYGLALAMLRQGRTFDALDIARDTDLSEEQRAMIARSALADQANQAFNAGHYGDAIAALDRRQRFAAEPRDLTLLRAWSLLRLNATQEARALFLMLDQQLSTRETQQGLGAVPSAQAAWMSN